MKNIVEYEHARQGARFKEQDRRFQNAVMAAYPHFKDPTIIALNVPDPRLTDILDATCDVSGMSDDILLGDRRPAELVIWRHSCLYIMWKLTDLPLTRVSRYMRLHHSSAINAVQKVRAKPRRFSLPIRQICARLGVDVTELEHGE